MSLKGKKQAFNILRGEGEEASLESYNVELDEGTSKLENVALVLLKLTDDLA
jgi:hypothetical protein